ncbi:MAG: hypothetical protein RLZZ397_681 [Pseudomonadota bacterium]
MLGTRCWLVSLVLALPLWASAQSNLPAAVSIASTPAAERAAPAPVDAGWKVQVEDGNSISRLVAPLVQAPNGVILEQAMMATYLANPQAFVDGNASRLVIGSWVNIPKLADARKISQADAREWWKAQKEWFAPAPPVAEAVSETNSPVEPEPVAAAPVAEPAPVVAPAPLQPEPPSTSLVTWIAGWPLWVWAFLGLLVTLVLGISLITPDRVTRSPASHLPKRVPVAPAGQPSAMVIDDELPPLDEDDDAPLSHPPKRALPSIDLHLGGRS